MITKNHRCISPPSVEQYRMYPDGNIIDSDLFDEYDNQNYGDDFSIIIIPTQLVDYIRG